MEQRYRIEIKYAPKWSKEPKRWLPVYYNIKREDVDFCLKEYEGRFEARVIKANN